MHDLWKDKGSSSHGTSFGKTKHASWRGLLIKTKMQRSGKPILVTAVIFTNARIWTNGCKWSQRWKTYFPRWSAVSLATYSRSWNKLQGMKCDNAGLTINAFFLLNYLLKCQLHCHPYHGGQRCFFWRCISMDQFWYIKIHTWLWGLG